MCVQAFKFMIEEFFISKNMLQKPLYLFFTRKNYLTGSKTRIK
jgi:hypothetical protein